MPVGLMSVDEIPVD